MSPLSFIFNKTAHLFDEPGNYFLKIDLSIFWIPPRLSPNVFRVLGIVDFRANDAIRSSTTAPFKDSLAGLELPNTIGHEPFANS